jgi:beta-ribofuranosylaminobenzene 5'-phosphate synthase
MVRIATPSRLHFGLFRLATAQDNLDLDSGHALTARHFGGVGLMIDKPGVALSVTPATTWSATGPLAGRALACAQAFLRHCPELPPQAFAITVEHCAPEHVGLGTGTQLALAVAKALATTQGRPDWDASFLASRVDRGQRSGIGVHGFQHGGFLVDGGKGPKTTLAPLVARHDFPAEWAVILILARDSQGVHGTREQEAFARLAKTETAQDTDALCRLVVLALLPSLVEHDLRAFGDALYEFNRRAGEMWRPWQGGIYSSRKAAEIVDFLRTSGVRAAGQSSWGPAVFATVPGEQATQITESLRKRFALSEGEVPICRAVNRGVYVVE